MNVWRELSFKKYMILKMWNCNGPLDCFELEIELPILRYVNVHRIAWVYKMNQSVGIIVGYFARLRIKIKRE